MTHIYKVTNTINGKIYVGQTKSSIEDRWKGHVKDALNESRRAKFQKAIKKYGHENFTIELIETCDPERANEREVFWISHFNAFVDGYNSTTGGDHFGFSEESKKKLSESRRGKSLSAETKQKLSIALRGEKNPNFGKKKSEETLRKMSHAKMGHDVTEETRQKIGNANRGKVRTEQTRAAMSHSKMNHEVSQETRQKIREKHLGKLVSEETRKKISQSKRGKKQSPESIAKRTESIKKTNERKRLLKLSQEPLSSTAEISPITPEVITGVN